jgi:glycosyltransferase involved in cell wall biosynthesis
MGGCRIGIVIPAFNEAKTIGDVVIHASRLGTAIVVDDGSSDTTSTVAEAFGAIVVRHALNRGYDGALNSGFARAADLGCDYIISMDADGQHDPATLPTFIKALEDGAEVVIGIRDQLQRFAEHFFAFVASVLWKINDPLCGMKGYTVDIYRELGHFDSYDSIGTELAIFAARRQKYIYQVPIRTRPRLDKPRFGNRFRSNVRILRALVYAFVARAR